jgi:magnesium and cobalt transporter
VPVRGELVPHPSGIEFEVLDADPRRIIKLKVHTRPRNAGKPKSAA